MSSEGRIHHGKQSACLPWLRSLFLIIVAGRQQWPMRIPYISTLERSLSVQPTHMIGSTRYLFCVLTAVLTGTALRWLVNADEALWYDEVWTGTIAIQDWRGALEISRDRFQRSPFLPVCLGLGANLRPSDAAIRAPGLIAGVAAPFVAWLLLRGRMPLHTKSAVHDHRCAVDCRLVLRPGGEKLRHSRSSAPC